MLEVLTMKIFGKRLSSFRKSRNLSQKELAERLNMAKSTLAMYEIGEREPSFETTQRIADFFECTVDYMLGRSDHPHYTKQQQEEEFDPELFEKLVEMYKEGKLTKEDIDQINQYAEFITRDKTP